jgi:hypothetical protein
MSCPCEAAEVVNDLPCERLLPSILSKTTGDRLKIRILSGLTHIVFVNSALMMWRKSPVECSEPASFKPNVRIGARYGKASKHSGHSCPHPERLELPKMIHRQRLQRQFPDQSMGVLLKIEGNCSCLKAKVAHMVGHLPGVKCCYVRGMVPNMMGTKHRQFAPLIHFSLEE